MSEEIHDVTDLPIEKTEFPWKKIMFALAVGATATGGAYLLSKKVESDSRVETTDYETPEA